MTVQATGTSPILCAHLLRRVDEELIDLLRSLVACELDLSPKLRQTVKTQFSENGELCHGNATEVHQRI